MTPILFYNTTYTQNKLAQTLNTEEVKNIFGFEYMESNLTQTIIDCVLHDTNNNMNALSKFMQRYNIMENTEKHIAIHPTCKDHATGFGLISLTDIRPHTIVMEYLGSNEKTDQINQHYYIVDFPDINGDIILIDSRYKGNLARFSFSLPNNQPILEETKVQLANLTPLVLQCPDRTRFFLKTVYSIKKGSELGWKYFLPSPNTYFINAANNECFQSSKNPNNILDINLPIITKYKTLLEANPINKTIALNLKHALHNAGKAQYALNNLPSAIKYYEKAIKINPVSLQEKFVYIKLISELYIYESIVGIDLNKENYDDYEISTTSKQFIETTHKLLHDKHIQNMYTRFANASESILATLKTNAGFCTKDHDDSLNISSERFFNNFNTKLIYMMCDLDDYCKAHSANDRCYIDHDIFTPKHCHSFTPLSKLGMQPDEVQIDYDINLLF